MQGEARCSENREKRDALEDEPNYAYVFYDISGAFCALRAAVFSGRGQESITHGRFASSSGIRGIGECCADF